MMAIIVRIEKKDLIPGMNPYKEKEIKPPKAIICSPPDHATVELPMRVSIIDLDYYKMKITGGTEIYIERKNIDLFIKMVEYCEYELRPTVHKMLVEQLQRRIDKENFGEKWFRRLYNSSLWDLIALRSEIKMINGMWDDNTRQD